MDDILQSNPYRPSIKTQFGEKRNKKKSEDGERKTMIRRLVPIFIAFVAEHNTDTESFKTL